MMIMMMMDANDDDDDDEMKSYDIIFLNPIAMCAHAGTF